MDDWFLGGARNFSFAQGFQNGSETHPVSYPVNTGRSFHRGKIAVVLKTTTHHHLVQRLILCGAVLSVPHCNFTSLISYTGSLFIAALCTLAVLYRKQHLLVYPMISAMSRTLLKEVHCILHCVNNEARMHP
jgi:hypothetical protein